MHFTRLLFAIVSLLLVQACATPGIGSPEGVVEDPMPTDSGSQADGPKASQEATVSGQVVPAIVGVPPTLGDSGTYRIGAHDVLNIEVFEVEELSSEERVSEDGTIVMPLIGAVTVGGRTPQEAETVIADILRQSYLQDPQVNIFVSEYASQDVTVAGTVKKPGVYPIKGRTTLLQSIALAGGLDKYAKEEEVIIFRGQGTASAKAYVVNLDHVQEGTIPDPVLVGDDRVVVPKSGTAVFVKGLTDALRGFVRLPVLGF